METNEKAADSSNEKRLKTHYQPIILLEILYEILCCIFFIIFIDVLFSFTNLLFFILIFLQLAEMHRADRLIIRFLLCYNKYF
jgi:hypothetical protein